MCRLLNWFQITNKIELRCKLFTMHEEIIISRDQTKAFFGAFSHESLTELLYCLSDYLFVFV